jgi:predicted GIY-YIG superfamily endonuclease
MDSHWQPCVYILAKASHGTLYTGVTSDLTGRNMRSFLDQ